MASPQLPYQDGAPDPEGGNYGENGAYQQEPAQRAQAPAAGGRKKRAYAGQAYEFGAGANSAQAAPSGGYAGSPAPAQAGYGYPTQQALAPSYGMPPQPAYGDPTAAQQPAYGQPQYGAPQGGYEAPQPGYQAPQQQQQPSMLQQGMQGVTQGIQQMGLGGGAAQQPPQPPQAAVRLNPLMPVDISMQGQPFHVSDLDQSPPAIILPPNVSLASLEGRWTMC